MPLVYNGMLAPLPELAQRGFRLVIHPGSMLRHFEDFRNSLASLRETGRIEVSLDSFSQAINALGVPEALELANRYRS